MTFSQTVFSTLLLLHDINGADAKFQCFWLYQKKKMTNDFSHNYYGQNSAHNVSDYTNALADFNY